MHYTKFVIRTIRIDTNESVYNRTSNLKKQLKRIKQILVDQNAGLIKSQRYASFINVDLAKVNFEVYPYDNTITGATVANDPKYSLYC